MFEPIQLNFGFEKRFLDKISFYQTIEKSFIPNILNTYLWIDFKIAFHESLENYWEIQKISFFKTESMFN